MGGSATRSTARRLASFACAVAVPFGTGFRAQHPTPEPTPHFSEDVVVERVILDARVLDRAGRPVLGLAPEDLEVSVDGEPAQVESVRWIGAPELSADLDVPREPGAQAVGPAGRLVVLFFQKDLERSRTPGLLRMIREASRIVDSLAPADRAAVASFDSHLKLWTDFTADRARLKRAMEQRMLFEWEPGAIEPGPDESSLARHLDPESARDAATPEAALLELAYALEPVVGSKSLVFFGGTMGEAGPTGVRLAPDYSRARQVLVRAQVTVFSLDLTDADSHTLEAGLVQVAHDTGGFYARTHEFGALAVRRVRGALAGHYVIVLVKPDLPRGRHRVEIGLPGREATVLARPDYVG